MTQSHNANRIEKVHLTKEEWEEFQNLKAKLNEAIAPSEAMYYKKQIDKLLAKRRN